MDPYMVLKQYIIDGYFKPGERLTEQALAELLQVSRTPIRQSLQQLQNDGLITPLKKGFIVRNFSEQDIIHIYNLRALLEGYACSLAATYRTAQHIKQLQSANEKYSDIITHNNKSQLSLQEVQTIMEANQAFHQTILTINENEFLHDMMRKLIILPLVFRSFYWYDKYELQRSSESHQIILHAIMEQDAFRAKTAMEEHVFHGRDHVLKHFDELQQILKEDVYDSVE